MAYGSKNNRKKILSSIVEGADGGSLMGALQASMREEDNRSRGRGAVSAAKSLEDTYETVSSMKRSLGEKQQATNKAINKSRSSDSSIAKDWMTVLSVQAEADKPANDIKRSELLSRRMADPQTDDDIYLVTGKPPPVKKVAEPDAITDALREALGEDEKEGPLSPDDMAITKANTDFPSRIDMDLDDNTDGKPKGLMSKPYDADRMKDANITADTGNTIIASSYLKDNSIAENGVFSQDALETAVSNTTDNNTFNAMLLGNIAKETGGGGPKTETGYGRLTGAQAATDKRTKGRGTGPEATARNAAYIALDSNPDFINGDFDQKSAMIFDIFYDDDNRAVGLKLGNTQPGDGSLFKGRGLVQITGRENYKLVQDQLAKSGIEVDFMANPDLINDPKYSLPAAVAFLELKGINKNNINELGPYKMSRLINAGEGSTEALDRWSEVTGLLTGTDAQNATDTNEKTAQTTAGITGNYPNTNISKIDGNIGAGSVTAFKAYLVAQGITIPKGASKYDLVRLVNQS